MMEVHTRVPLTEKEGEAIMWGLGQIVNYPSRRPRSDTDPLSVLLNEGFRREAIMTTGNDLFQLAYGDCIQEPLSELERAILRVCVENTTWVEQYIEHRPQQAEEARATLRSLATKLETLGIEVNHIPND